MPRYMTEDAAHKAYDEMLDELDTVRIGSLRYDASDVLKHVDPTAYRCGFNDWCDSEGVTTSQSEATEYDDGTDLPEPLAAGTVVELGLGGGSVTVERVIDVDLTHDGATYCYLMTSGECWWVSDSDEEMGDDPPLAQVRATTLEAKS